jgi:3-oxoacyl-[acyl-carrier protein] reductase
MWPSHTRKAPTRPRRSVKEIERAGGKAIAIRRTPPMLTPARPRSEKTVAAFGRLDVLVNNAGTAIPKTFEETTLREWTAD